MVKTGKWMALGCTLVLMALIFFFSAQTGSESSRLSNSVTDKVQTSTIAKAATPQWFSAANLNANLRKWAHFYIYCLLGASMAATVQLFNQKQRRLRPQIVRTILYCTFYAISDEIHQLFVPGRAAMWQDVLLDAAGFLPCLLLIFGGGWLFHHRRRAKAE